MGEAVDPMFTQEPDTQGRNMALELRGIVKNFPGVLANDHVNLKVYAGEVHALLGENGAGKSTLMEITYGLYQKDEGEILLNNQPVSIRTPQDAMRLGIGMVHQHFMLIPAFSVIENMVLGMKCQRYPLLDLEQSTQRVKELAEELEFHIPLSTKVSDLTVGQRQKAEIIKALYRGAKILILDEPTAVLLPQEIEELFTLIQRLREDGVTIVFISHKLNEVIRVSDRVTVMRRGRVIRTLNTIQTTAAELAELMVGQAVDLTMPKEKCRSGEVKLEVKDVCARDDMGVTKLNGLCLSLKAGEIHGLAGVDGNGQQTLVEVLMGLRSAEKGCLIFGGSDMTHVNVAGRIRAGIEHIPEDRQTEGLVLGLSIRDNLLLEHFTDDPFAKNGWLQFDAMNEHAWTLMKEFDIRAPDPNVEVRKLSGGNQQKVALARAIWCNPAVLIAMQPTRGLDIGAATFVRRQMIEARDRGCAVLLISSELDEIMALSDVVSVIYEGRIVETRPTTATNLNRIGFLMAGGRPEDAPVGQAEEITYLT
jgi:simple sugar transport system ATP-binding protein